MNIDAVLVQAPAWTVQTPPYAPALLKAVCAAQGYRVQCLDFNAAFYRDPAANANGRLYRNLTDWFQEAFTAGIIREQQNFIGECVKTVLNIPCRLVGFSVSGLSIGFAKAIGAAVKAAAPEKIIVFGGPYCFRTERGPALLAEHQFIDAVCFLEGELVLPRMIAAVKENGRLTAPVAGAQVRTAGGEIIGGGDDALLSCLDELPFADFSDYDLKQYTAPELPLSTSRGCINRCRFCSESAVWQRYRFRGAQNIYAEICRQVERYPHTKSFYFNDSLINGHTAVLERLCDLLIRGRPDVYWGGQAAIRGEMSARIIRKMKQAGCTHVSYGLESAHCPTLERIGKRFSPETAERVLRETKNAGIRTDVNIIVGFPGEDEESISATAQFLRRNRAFIDEIFFHPLVVSAGSFYYEHREELGIEFEDRYNPNSWYITREGNTLEKRLEWLKLYQDYTGRAGESFFDMSDYFVFLADEARARHDHKKARGFYEKARQLNDDEFKDAIIREKSAGLRREDTQ